jgi:hypothetical protein
VLLLLLLRAVAFGVVASQAERLLAPPEWQPEETDVTDVSGERIALKHRAWRREALAAAKQSGLLPKDAERLPEPLVRAIAIRADHMTHRAEFLARLGRKVDRRDLFHADIAYLLGRGLITEQQARTANAWLRDAPALEVVEEHVRVGRKYFGALYREAIADARRKIRARGVELRGLR